MTTAARYTPLENLLRLFTRVRPGEGRCVVLFFLHVFLLLFAYYVFKSLREALVLSGTGAEMRAYAQATTALLLLAIVPLYSALRRRVDGERLVNVVFWGFVAALAVFWALGSAGWRLGFAFFVLIGIFAVMVVAQFWALAADTFNLKSGQRLFPVIAAGAAFGAVAGAKFTSELVGWLGPWPLVLVAVGVLASATLLTGAMRRAVPAGSRHSPSTGPRTATHWLGGFKVVRDSRYLMLIALAMVLTNLVSTTGDTIHSFLVKQHVAALEAAGELAPGAAADAWVAAYFGDFMATMTLAQFLIQLFVVARLFQAIGVAGALLALPLLACAGYAAVAVFPVLTVIRLVRMSEMAIEYSVNGTARNALFLPTSRAETYDGKTTIETFFWRFGDLLSAGAVFACRSLFEAEVVALVAMNVVAAAVGLGVALLIGREYRRLARRALVNAAPVLSRAIPPLEAAPGRPFAHRLPEDLFFDADPGDVLTLSARLKGGGPLPAWLEFDAANGEFRGRAMPPGTGTLEVEVTATDNDGVSASGTLTIRCLG